MYICMMCTIYYVIIIHYNLMIVVVVLVVCHYNILVEYAQPAAGEGKLHTLYLGEYVSTHLRWVPVREHPC